MEFHQLLRKARNNTKLTQQQVADKLGITKSTYCGYETGKRQPDPRRIKEIAKVLGVSPNDFFKDEDDISIGSAKIEILDEELNVLISYYNQLNDSGKHFLIEQAESLTFNPKYKKHNSISSQEVG